MKMPTVAVIILAVSSNIWGLQTAANAQDQPKSLADIARENKKSKQKSEEKVVLNDDNFPGREQPPAPKAISSSPAPSNAAPQSFNAVGIPPLFRNDEDNSDEVVKAVEIIKNKQGAATAEAALHTWYNKYDAMTAAALKRYKQTAAKPKEQVQMNEAVDAIKTFRLAIALASVRMKIEKLGLSPDWFKLRCSDGNYPPSSGCPK
jgi:hypothetical protein